MPKVKVFTGDDRDKPRYHRDYRLTVHDVPTWAVLALVDLLTKEAERFDYDLELPVASVTVELHHISVEEDDNEAYEAFWENTNALGLAVTSELVEVRKGQSVAEIEAEEARKR